MSGFVLWLTGLPASGKTTLARALEKHLSHLNVVVLDGDILRRGLSSDLGFLSFDRHEHNRRVAEVASLFADSGFIVICALVSPYRLDRSRAHRIIGADRFHEVYLRASLETCEQRDPKGNYKRARLGEIQEFTGITAPYEIPQAPALVVDTQNHTEGECLIRLGMFVKGKI